MLENVSNPTRPAKSNAKILVRVFTMNQKSLSQTDCNKKCLFPNHISADPEITMALSQSVKYEQWTCRHLQCHDYVNGIISDNVFKKVGGAITLVHAVRKKEAYVKKVKDANPTAFLIVEL
jgi:hypothetical protein